MEIKQYEYPFPKPTILPGYVLYTGEHFGKLVRISNELGFDWYSVYSPGESPTLLARYFASYAVLKAQETATEIKLYESEYQQATIPSGYVEAPGSEHGRLSQESIRLGYDWYAVLWMPATERSRPGPLLLRRYFASTVVESLEQKELPTEKPAKAPMRKRQTRKLVKIDQISDKL